MTHAIRMHKTGGPEVLSWEEVSLGKPGPGEVRLRHTAIGLNYIDTYHRSGLYPLPLPTTIGSEGAGVVEEVGPSVSGLKVGDRVAYGGGPLGSYCEARNVAADRLVPIPQGVSDQQAAAMMLKGMTAQYLIRRTYRVKAGDTILIHAAARRRRSLPSAMAAITRSSIRARISWRASPRSPAARRCPSSMIRSARTPS